MEPVGYRKCVTPLRVLIGSCTDVRNPTKATDDPETRSYKDPIKRLSIR